MIVKPTTVKFFVPTAIEKFDATAEPTLEGIAGEDHLGNAIASGGQAINAMDSHPHRKVQVTTNSVATTFRIDGEYLNRIKADFMLIDQHNLRDVYPAAERPQIGIHHHTADVFGSATEISADRVITGLLGKRRPYLDLDGDNDYINVSDHADLDVGVGDFALQWHGRPDTVSVANQMLIHKQHSALSIFYGLELRNDDLWILIDDDNAPGSAKIGTAICAAGDDVYIWVDFDRSHNASAWVKVNDGDLTLVGTVDISSTSADMDNDGGFRIGSENDGTTKTFKGRIYSASKWGALAVTLTQVESYMQGARSANLDASYICTGINEGEGKWYDDSGNGRTGTITGAEYHDHPYDDDFGFYFAAFTEAEDKYWFIEINNDGVTANNEAALLGQLILGRQFVFNGFKPEGFGGEYDYSGILMAETDMGIIQAEETYGLRPTFDIPFALSTRAQFVDLQLMVDAIKGALYPLYVCFDYDQPLPVIWRVRIKGGLKWSYVHGLSQPWRPTLELVMDN